MAEFWGGKHIQKLFMVLQNDNWKQQLGEKFWDFEKWPRRVPVCVQSEVKGTSTVSVNLRFSDQITNILYLLSFEGKDKSKYLWAAAASGSRATGDGGKWVSPAWVSGSKINWSRWVSLWQASRRHDVGVGGGVTGWVSLSRLSISDLSVSLSFLFFFFLRFFAFSVWFGFGLLIAEFVCLFFLYRFTWVMGWPDDRRGARAKTRGGPSAFLFFFLENSQKISCSKRL